MVKRREESIRMCFFLIFLVVSWYFSEGTFPWVFLWFSMVLRTLDDFWMIFGLTKKGSGASFPFF